MQCPQCQHDNRDQAKFCEDCGARLAAKCAACGTELGAAARYCSECGAPVAGPSAATPATLSEATNRFASPQAYIPQHLAERIISSRGALEGERKQVTVLFADLKGSMELLADRDPEEARAILDPVLERMMEAVHRYEGTVNQVMGDGIMALFGAPLAHEDHAVRACYAALRMQEAVRQYADEVFRARGVRVQIRVGLNSGEVVVRSIGSDLRMDYTAVGQTTHLAARMEQTALPGSVLLAPDTLRLAEGYVQVQALGPVPIKGMDASVDVYELVGAGTARSRLQAAAVRGLTQFVGRDAELETLRRTLDHAGSGHGQVVALVGEPGVGKSRLVWEFGHSHRTQGWLALESSSVSYGKATSYLPIIDLLKSYCDIEDRDDARRIREKLSGKLLTLDPVQQPLLAPLLALLGVPVADAQWQALDPPQRRQRTLDAVKRLILRESQEQPLLLVFEDLHWIDAETQALLDSLVDSLPTARLLLLVNYRPEYEHAWHRKTYYQQLRLDPLPPESAEALLSALLGDAPELRPLKQALIQRTEGNPFFVEESVRTLVESGTLAGERGAYRLTRPSERAQVPATVQAVLAARIDRLDPDDKRLLQTAAVIGKDVPYPLLQASSELPGDALRQGLVRLQAAEFLYETSLFPDLEYTFKHALTHEVAYGSLLQDRRCALHARIVGAIEELYPDRLAEHVERLAQHAVRGELWERAVTYLQQAGRKATARSAYREATTCFEQALDALARLPQSQPTREQAIDVHLGAANALAPLAELARFFHHLRSAEALAEAVDDQRRLAQVYVDQMPYYRWIGDHELAAEVSRRALTIAAELDDRALVGASSYYIALASYDLGDYSTAHDYCHRSLAALADDRLQYRHGPGTVTTTAHAWLGACLAEWGRFAEGLATAEEAVRQAESDQRPWDLSIAHVQLGQVHLLRGDHDEAIRALERALAICESAGIPRQVPTVAARLGGAYVLAGRVGAATALLERAMAQADAVDVVHGQALRTMRLGEALLLADRRVDAERTAEQGLALARAHKERGNEAWALRLLGAIAAEADPPEAEQAAGYYRQALALAEELGMRPLQAHCHLGLGTLYRRVGRDEQARAELVTAIEMYRTMEMPFWLEKAEAALARVAH